MNLTKNNTQIQANRKSDINYKEHLLLELQEKYNLQEESINKILKLSK